VTAALDWQLECTACGNTRNADGLPTVCDRCGQPWLVRYQRAAPTIGDRAEIRRGHGMWRFRHFLPLLPGEEPVTLGEGDTPLLAVPRLAEAIDVSALLVKDEGGNPTGSFKARGMSAAITRARAAGATRLVAPTAGNAGVALAAYAARAGLDARVYAPTSSPATILQQIRFFGADLQLVDGHIGDCGRMASEWSATSGAYNVSTLREPYRIEGKKTLGLELALQLGWRLPDAIIYPTGGGTGLIGMWKAFNELITAGWVLGPPPRLFTVQSAGCAPVVQAFEQGAERCAPWPDPVTVASGLRVPAPLGDRLMLEALRASNGGVVAVPDADLEAAAALGTAREGIDVSPEGGAAIAAVSRLVGQGVLSRDAGIVIFNTGAGWLYR
jgi:threonine synthase